ncbi:Crp/Fnr family transcriptional regulator [Pseudomonas sp. MYb185]|uniref:Crp/Fnr family transcriptional regulator n=1 Tax=Pseudomonas sp. MYb185 TaxID=1848729 RepID=UPI000CFD4C5C|nr:Crp/Fnr family transcriptional regulator [Pseudomonas sp. MYb185]PRB81380.1 Crp/Fnr family transcriptional regulator [Pseudomonas sp. MYb185]
MQLRAGSERDRPAAELIGMLERTPMFARVDRQVLSPLLVGAEPLHLHGRQHLFYMGQQATHFYLVKAGALTLYRPSYTGDNKVFRTVEKGDLLVETAMFLSQPEYPLSAQAATDVIVYRIPRDNLLQLCRACPDFSLAMLSGMAERISQSLNRIDLLTIGNAAQRLVLYLMDLYIQQRRAWLVLPVAQSVLARQLNITPETLSRQLSSFRRSGLIGDNHPDVVLLDIEGLCRSVGLPPPDLKFEGESAARRLGSSLFDCCNYASQVLGKR